MAAAITVKEIASNPTLSLPLIESSLVTETWTRSTMEVSRLEKYEHHHFVTILRYFMYTIQAACLHVSRCSTSIFLE